MRAVRWAPVFALCLALVVLPPFGAGCADDERTEVVVVAETRLRDPDVYFKVEGDFVAPEGNEFVNEGFRRFLSGEIWSEDRRAILVGDRAWLKTNEDWIEKPISDPEVQQSIESNPGTTQFWTGFLDTSQLEELKGSNERVNGVDAKKITTQDAQLVQRALGADDTEEEPWRGLEEFTVWLAEDGGWPVAMRLVVLSDEYPFQHSEEDDSEVRVTYEALPEVLRSYHYGVVIASQRETDAGTAGGQYRIEYTLAISHVNDSTITIDSPD